MVISSRLSDHEVKPKSADGLLFCVDDVYVYLVLCVDVVNVHFLLCVKVCV